MSLKQAKSTAGLHGHALKRAKSQPLGTTQQKRRSNVQHDSVDNLLAIAEHFMEDPSRQVFCGDDLYALLVLLGSLAEEEILRIFSTVAKILEGPQTSISLATAEKGIPMDASYATTSSLEEMPQ